MGSKGVIVIVHQTPVLMEAAVLWRLQKVKRDRDGYAVVVYSNHTGPQDTPLIQLGGQVRLSRELTLEDEEGREAGG